MNTLNTAIEATRASWYRHDQDLDRRYPYTQGMCCQSCAYGTPYLLACLRLQRITAELVRLLRKRGTECDLLEATRWEMDLPVEMRPGTKKKKEGKP